MGMLITFDISDELGFGQHPDRTVGLTLHLGGRGWLRWVYYNVPSVTFSDEVLNKLGITSRWRIDKPGVNVVLHRRLQHELRKRAGRFKPFPRAPKSGRKKNSDGRRDSNAGDFSHF